MTAISSRKRGKRRYFWEYSEQLTPSQQERMLRPSEWDRDTLPSNMYQKNGLHHGKKSSAWSQMAVSSLWQIQQPKSPPCKCWEFVFWLWKLKHCKSVTQQCPGKAQWAHSRDFQCGFFQRSVDELRIVTSKGSQWKPQEFKAFSVGYCKYWMVTWQMFAARGCSVSAACVSRRLGGLWGAKFRGLVWAEDKH